MPNPLARHLRPPKLLSFPVDHHQPRRPEPNRRLPRCQTCDAGDDAIPATSPASNRLVLIHGHPTSSAAPFALGTPCRHPSRGSRSSRLTTGVNRVMLVHTLCLSKCPNESEDPRRLNIAVRFSVVCADQQRMR
ncbi:hypothetical protein SEVIR_6G115045v4 [Setaria viridis]